MTAKKTSPHPIGENVPRVDAREKVTGAALFADDIQFGPGLLYARIKRSPHPHALIKRIDASKALALPGVKAVVTGADYPGFTGLYLQDRHIFCRERARYVGDPVAGVAAVTEEIAEQAVALIEVDYEPLPGGVRPGIWRFSGGSAAASRPGQIRSDEFHLPGGGHEYLQPLQDPQRRCGGSLERVRGDCRARLPRPAYPTRADRNARGDCESGRGGQGDTVDQQPVALRAAQPDRDRDGHLARQTCR